ncbi:hypothetical protein DRN62_00245 [Nanoarchaeota archaeon]|nr:MAG: hypothetical protein DRN62_00245 [Nanoarchaeota archaeon]
MEEQIKTCKEVMEDAHPQDVLILSHADHDGLTSVSLIDLIYSDLYDSLTKKLHPSKTRSYYKILNEVLRLKPAYFLIVDALVKPYERLIEKIAKQGTKVINLDHHDMLSVSHENYLDLNPHKWKMEFMNSSGLCWLIAREFNRNYFEKRCWVAGIGAIQDYCIEDNKELMKELAKRHYIRETTLASTLDSKLLEIAKAINSASRLYPVNTVYQIIFQAAARNDVKMLETNEKLVKALESYRKKLEGLYDQIKKKEISVGSLKVKFYDLKGNNISLISEICEKERENAIYVGYSNGLLGFRSLFYEYDVRELAKLFNGGGPHPRVGGARTGKTFEEVINEVVNHLKGRKSQRTLNEFR